MLTVNQHLSGIQSGNEVTQGYKLEPGKWKNSTNVISSAFNDIEEVDVLLSNGECPNGEATSK